MHKKRGFLQTTALVAALASVVLAVTCAAFLYLKVDQLGFQHPVSASLTASIFFFIFVGIVLAIIGTTNLPSFKFDSENEPG